MTEEEKRSQLLKLARLSINFSLSLIAVGVLVIILIIYPPNFGSSNAIEPKLTESKSEFSIDSTEIKNGIHVPSGLIADEGFELVLKTCVVCHSIEVVKQNRATKEGWKNMLVWMQETQGLWDLGEDEEPILNYLAKNYAPTNSGRRKNLENIVWYNLKED